MVEQINEDLQPCHALPTTQDDPSDLALIMSFLNWAWYHTPIVGQSRPGRSMIHHSSLVGEIPSLDNQLFIMFGALWCLSSMIYL